MPVRWVSHASMPSHTYTLEHNHLTQFLVCEFLCQPQACKHGPFRKRTLHVMCLCLSLAALGLVALAGCEDHNPSHFNTEAETMQVPSLSEHLFRPTPVISILRQRPCRCPLFPSTYFAQVLLFPFLFATIVPWHTLELLSNLPMPCFSTLILSIDPGNRI
jgi:hypothetical protein